MSVDTQAMPRKKASKPKAPSPQEKEEEIVLHLNITMNDIKKFSGKHDPSNEVFIKKEESDDSEDNNLIKSPHDIFAVDDHSDQSSDSYKGMTDDKHMIHLLREKDELIVRLNKELDQAKRKLMSMSGFRERKLYNSNIKLLDVENGKQVVVEKTDIACFWCSHKFSTPPCFIPQKYHNGVYHVYGNFCSYNCAAAYNISLDDYRTWDRHALMQKLYSEISDSTEQIVPAPSRLTLKLFGGPLSIEEFRHDSIACEKEYRYIMPPMMPVVGVVEQDFKDKQMKIHDNSLRVQRSKPLPGAHNNLFRTMGLKKKTKKSAG